MTDRKKPGLAFWATVVVVVPILYVASFGPACWIISRLDAETAWIPTVYRPITIIWDSGPSQMGTILESYSAFGCERDWGWIWVNSTDIDGNPVEFWAFAGPY